MPVYRCVELLRYPNASEVRVTHHLQTLDPFLESDLQDVADFFETAWDTNLKSLMFQFFEIYGVSIQRVDIADEPSIVVPVGPTAGTVTSDALPVQIALVVNFRSFTQRPNYARKFLAGWGEAASNGALPGSTQIAAAEAWADDLLAVNVIGSTSVDYRTARYSGSPSLVTSTNPLTTRQISPFWGTQRRRRQGRGA